MKRLLLLLTLLVCSTTATAVPTTAILVGDQIAILRYSYVSGGLALQKFDSSGAPSSPVLAIPIEWSERTSMATDGTDIFVIGIERGTTCCGAGIDAVMVDGNNEIRPLPQFHDFASFPYSELFYRNAAADVIWDGSQFVVAWASAGGPPYHIATTDSRGGITRQLDFSDDSISINQISLVAGRDRDVMAVSSRHESDTVVDVLTFDPDLRDLRTTTRLDTVGLGTNCYGVPTAWVEGGVFDGARFVLTWVVGSCRNWPAVRYAELEPDGSLAVTSHISESGVLGRDSWLYWARPYATPAGVVILTGSPLQLLQRVGNDPLLFRGFELAGTGLTPSAVLSDGRIVAVAVDPATDAVFLTLIDPPRVSGRRVIRH